MDICITEESIGRVRKESLFGGRYTVTSRSGLNVTETQIIETFKGLPRPENMLFLENRTGASGIIAGNMFPQAQITIHCLDLYYANKIRRNLSRNGVSSVDVCCQPYVERKNACDVVFLQLSKGGASKELALDILQQSHQALRLGGKCFLSVEGSDPWARMQAEKLFGGYAVCGQNNQGYCIVAGKKEKLKRVRDYRSEFTMTIFGKKPIRLCTIPGIFSHREIDQGALALAEIATGEAKKGDAVLDMGCGCGAIGISIAVNQELSRLCFVDANARAVSITKENCRLNGLDRYEVVFSDAGIEETRGFTLFTGNPPYFSHYKIAELFVDTAYKALKPGGRAYLVAKTSAWHYNAMKSRFGNATLINRRGYGIVKSIKGDVS